MLWKVIGPILKNDKRHFLQSSLLERSDNKNSTILIIGQIDFINRTKHSLQGQKLNVDYLTIPLDNFCLFGQAIKEISKRHQIDKYWIQSSPKSWSNRNSKIIKQNLEYWNLYKGDLEINTLRKRISIFFDSLKILLLPSKIENKEAITIKREKNTKKLSFTKNNSELTCFSKALDEASIESEKIYFIRYVYRSAEINMDFLNKFNACFENTKCFKNASFFKQAPVQ